MIKQKIASILISFLVLFQVFDGYFTYIGVKYFGLGIEGNPLMRLMIETFGHLLGLTIAKSVGICFIYFIYEACKETVNNKIILILSLLDIFYFIVVFEWFRFLIEKGLV